MKARLILEFGRQDNIMVNKNTIPPILCLGMPGENPIIFPDISFIDNGIEINLINSNIEVRVEGVKGKGNAIDITLINLLSKEVGNEKPFLVHASMEIKQKGGD